MFFINPPRYANKIFKIFQFLSAKNIYFLLLFVKNLRRLPSLYYIWNSKIPVDIRGRTGIHRKKGTSCASNLRRWINPGNSKSSYLSEYKYDNWLNICYLTVLSACREIITSQCSIVLLIQKQLELWLP